MASGPGAAMRLRKNEPKGKARKVRTQALRVTGIHTSARHAARRRAVVRMVAVVDGVVRRGAEE